MATEPVKATDRVSASRFKAKCLGLLDEVARTGRPLIVTKHGKPVAKVVPTEADGEADLQGTIHFEKDIVSPTGEPWDAER